MQNGVVVERASEAEMEKVMAKLDMVFARLRTVWVEASDLLARLTGPQMDQVKRRFRGIVRADHLDRLAMFGRREIGEHLAIPERSVRASLLRRLPAATLAALNDPDREVEVWSADGHVFAKRLCTLCDYEFDQVVDEHGKIRSADAQRRRLLAANARPAAADGEHLIFEGLTIAENGLATLWWRSPEDEPGTKRYQGNIPQRSLREVLR